MYNKTLPEASRTKDGYQPTSASQFKQICYDFIAKDRWDKVFPAGDQLPVYRKFSEDQYRVAIIVGLNMLADAGYANHLLKQSLDYRKSVSAV